MTDQEKNELRQEYREYAAEARACGQEVELFDVWAGIADPKSNAMGEAQAVFNRDEHDIY